MTQHFTDGEGRQISISETKSRGTAHVHKYVAQVARQAANELYDELMRDNVMYKSWCAKHEGYSAKRLRAVFVAKYWGSCIPLARATMARLLATSTDEALKETIYEALCLDATLKRGRNQ